MTRQRKKKGRSISGWVILDKPDGIGSTQCVSKIKWLYQAAKAGHAGTLDPLASGMLPIALGEATKTVPFVMDGEKVYRFTIAWGIQTNSDDSQGEIINTSSERPDETSIRKAMANYIGEIEQVPPAFSAIKINGERAYKKAREGEEVKIEARTVHIHRFDLIELIDENSAVFEIECGKGTYVRSLARDIGNDLGCYGHISQLRRLSVYPFHEDDLIPLDEMAALEGELDALDNEVLPTGIALENLTEIEVTKDQAQRIRAGNPVLLRGRDAISFAENAFAVWGQELVAVGSVDKGSFQPFRVFKVSAV